MDGKVGGQVLAMTSEYENLRGHKPEVSSVDEIQDGFQVWLYTRMMQHACGWYHCLNTHWATTGAQKNPASSARPTSSRDDAFFRSMT